MEKVEAAVLAGAMFGHRVHQMSIVLPGQGGQTGDISLSVPGSAPESGYEALEVVGNLVYFGNNFVELEASGLLLRLFRLFAVARDGRCSLREILAVVYQLRPMAANSKRYRKSARVRAVKLISRARHMAKVHLCADLDWFRYDRGTSTWRLLGRRRPPTYLQ